MSSNTFDLSRREFLSCSAAFALSASARFAAASPSLLPAPNKLLDHRRILGRTSPLEVSAIGLGCLPMVGYYGGTYDKKDMIALIRRAYDEGCTFFDTAEV